MMTQGRKAVSSRTDFDAGEKGPGDTRWQVIAECPDCQDPALVEDPSQKRCDACHSYHLDAQGALARRMANELVGLRSYDSPRDVLCDDCSGTAAQYERSVAETSLDGKTHVCESCETIGKLYLMEGDEFGTGELRFRPYTEKEIAERGL